MFLAPGMMNTVAQTVILCGEFGVLSPIDGAMDEPIPDRHIPTFFHGL